MEESDKPRKGFRYIQTPYGSVVAAYEFTEKGRERHYKVGVAFCSPKDQFNKARGRMIADGRLAKGRACMRGFCEHTVIRAGEEKFDYPNVTIERMLNEYPVTMGKYGVPQWFGKALAYYNDEQARLAEERAA